MRVWLLTAPVELGGKNEMRMNWRERYLCAFHCFSPFPEHIHILKVLPPPEGEAGLNEAAQQLAQAALHPTCGFQKGTELMALQGHPTC